MFFPLQAHFLPQQQNFHLTLYDPFFKILINNKLNYDIVVYILSILVFRNLAIQK